MVFAPTVDENRGRDHHLAKETGMDTAPDPNRAFTPRFSRGLGQRKLRNLLLQPLLQIRLGLYSILLTIFFSGMILGVLYLNLMDFTQIVLALTDSESEIRDLFADYISQTIWWIGILIVTFIASSIVLSVTYTHKLVGPTIAFRHQLQKLQRGQFDNKIQLRKGDAFQEIANEINMLTDVMQQISQQEDQPTDSHDQRKSIKQEG